MPQSIWAQSTGWLTSNFKVTQGSKHPSKYGRKNWLGDSHLRLVISVVQSVVRSNNTSPKNVLKECRIKGITISLRSALIY